MGLGDVVATVVGIAILVVVGIPVIGMVVTVAATAVALQVAIVVAVGGYLLGIPWSIYFRLRHGRWPRPD